MQTSRDLSRRALTKPYPHTATRTDDIAVLLELIEQAEDAYARLLGEHLEHAERILADLAAGATAVGE